MKIFPAKSIALRHLFYTFLYFSIAFNLFAFSFFICVFTLLCKKPTNSIQTGNASKHNNNHILQFISFDAKIIRLFSFVAFNNFPSWIDFRYTKPRIATEVTHHYQTVIERGDSAIAGTIQKNLCNYCFVVQIYSQKKIKWVKVPLPLFFLIWFELSAFT